MTINYKEIAFEQAIEHYLVQYGGYTRGNNETFNPEYALDPAELVSFIKETQSKEWQYLQNILKDKAESTLIEELSKAMASDHEGCLKVLRHGFKCYGKTFRVAYFKPPTSLNPETKKRYSANRLSITRQLKYSTKHNNKIDVVLSLNGIPLVTIELKNPMSGQTWRNAVHQYKNDRDQNDLVFQFKKRSLVHFAVDTDEAQMTTRLKGKATQFLPFNKGVNNGAGNPENPDGYKTAYLWEEVLSRDSFLDILARFIQWQIEEKQIGNKFIRKELIIFPRYHQLDTVRKMIADAKTSQTGKSYLVEHSAGSGKSNTISWLAHRLVSLHDDNDEKIFDSVVVITDRLVLDQQLQNTIYEFEHKQGVVNKIDKDSTQLAEALASAAPIIVTTLQKFPFVTEKIGELPNRDYAVIIDEAHSSQSGESAAEMKKVLSSHSIKEQAAKEADEEKLPDYEEEIIKAMAKRGKQPNISFFAFTATPKYKTMEIFGEPGPDGKPQPFHLYSMRQAIEEGFIIDVLQNYITYKTYYNLVKKVNKDPKVEKRKAAKALARYLSLHPHNIAEKTKIMMEHFNNSTTYKIGGKAKAMVVTASRLHAVRYKLAFDKYIKEMGYSNINTLVAFSDTVVDPDIPGKEYTETGMNGGIREKELPEKFATDKYQILIVAEKYQTGFDQPLLHTMYVDKRLSGVQAVQTLSRLNRTHYGKEDTFVLDFVNDTKEILDSFQPYYEQTTISESVEPRHLYELQATIEDKRIFDQTEIDEFARVFYQPIQNQSNQDHARMNSIIDLSVSRFKELEENEQEDFRKVLISFRNLYAFMSQIIPFRDSDLEKLYSFVRFFLTKIPKSHRGPVYKFDEEIELKYYRVEKTYQGKINIAKNRVQDISGPSSVGTSAGNKETITLSKLIDILNERFGTEFKPSDQLFFDSIKEGAKENSKLKKAAQVNTLENFGYVFNKMLEDLFIERMDLNSDITARFMNDKKFRDIVTHQLQKQIWEEIRENA